MMKKRFWTILPAVLLCALLLCACGGEPGFDCPFSDVQWSVTPGELTAALGDPGQIYASVYGGDTYVYNKEYLDCSGSVKYMFSDSGELASMAWSLTGSDGEIGKVFEQINGSETKLRGESAFSAQNDATNGNVWYLDAGDVLISRISVNGSSALQYAYILKDFSKR